MAPIYLAQKISPSPKTGPNLFSSKGIIGYKPSTISSLAIVGIPHEKQIAYGAYSQNVDAFIYATSIKERVATESQGFPNFKMKDTFTFPLPPVTFAPAFDVKPENEDGILSKLGAGAIKFKTGKRTVFNIPNPSEQVFGLISANQDEAFGAGDEAITPRGYDAALFLNNAISGFLATHTYAAFRTDSVKDEGPMELRTVTGVKGDPHLVFNVDHESLELFTFSHRFPVELERPEFGDAGEARDKAEEKWNKTIEKKLLAIKLSNITDAVAIAKPSPAQYTINFGNAASIPAMGGIVFPYFEGSSLPDPTMMKVVTALYFIRLLGGDLNTVEEKYTAMRRGFNSLATTKIGMVYSHMCAGIQLAVQCQARVYMVMEGTTYKGFALLGARFSVFDGAKMIRAQTMENLRADFATFDPHYQAMKVLAEEFEAMRVDGHIAGEDLIQVEDVDTIQKIIIKLSEIKIVESEDESKADIVKDLNKALRSLSFTPIYRQIGPAQLQFVLDATLDESLTIPLDYPFFFPSWDMNYSDRLIRLLVGFGSEAPSPFNVSGGMIALEPTEEIELKDGKRKPTGKTNIYGNLPDQLIFAPKPTEIAIREWKQCLENRSVKMDLKERARGYRAMRISAEDTRKGLWSSMVQLAEKRKLEKPSASKKAKVVKTGVASAEEFLKL